MVSVCVVCVVKDEEEGPKRIWLRRWSLTLLKIVSPDDLLTIVGPLLVDC